MEMLFLIHRTLIKVVSGGLDPDPVFSRWSDPGKFHPDPQPVVNAKIARECSIQTKSNNCG